MKSVSKIKHLHVSPQKCRLVAGLIRNMEVTKAEAQLVNLRKKAAQPILKLLNNAISSAEHNKDMLKDNLYIKDIFVDEGTTMKRWQPRAFGRAYSINHRTSHITLILDEKVKGKKKKMKKSEKSEKDEKKKEEDEKKMDKKDSSKKKKFEQKDLQKDTAKSSDKGVFKRIFRRKSV